jgi:hypothetical protein
VIATIAGGHIQRGAERLDLSPDMPIFTGDRVSTGSGGAIVGWNERSFILLSAGTDLEVVTSDRLSLDVGSVSVLAEWNSPDAEDEATFMRPLLAINVPAGEIDVATGDYEITVSETRRETMVLVNQGRAVLASGAGTFIIESPRAARWTAYEHPRLASVAARASSTLLDDLFTQLRGARDLDVPSYTYLPEPLRLYAWLFHAQGSWYADEEYGTYWVPRTETGSQPWPTHHYGSWMRDARGTRAWIPGNTWTPSTPPAASVATTVERPAPPVRRIQRPLDARAIPRETTTPAAAVAIPRPALAAASTPARHEAVAREKTFDEYVEEARQRLDQEARERAAARARPRGADRTFDDYVEEARERQAHERADSARRAPTSDTAATSSGTSRHSDSSSSSSSSNSSSPSSSSSWSGSSSSSSSSSPSPSSSSSSQTAVERPSQGYAVPRNSDSSSSSSTSGSSSSSSSSSSTSSSSSSAPSPPAASSTPGRRHRP